MQQDATGRPRPVSFQSRQLRKAERNHPVHDLELLAMKYALAKFRIYLVGGETSRGLYRPRVTSDGDQLATYFPADGPLVGILC